MKTKHSLIGLTLLTITACGGDSPDNEDSSSNGSSSNSPSNETSSNSPSNGASSNSLSYRGSSYPLEKGLEEFSEPKGNHYRSRFNITDGEYTSVQAQAVAGNLYYTWLARDASVWIFGKFYSPGSTQKLSSKRRRGHVSFFTRRFIRSHAMACQQLLYQCCCGPQHD